MLCFLCRIKLSQTFISDATSDAHGSSDAESKESSEFHDGSSFILIKIYGLNCNIGFFVDYSQLLYELISWVVRGQLGHDEVIQLLAEIVVCDVNVEFKNY